MHLKDGVAGVLLKLKTLPDPWGNLSRHLPFDLIELHTTQTILHAIGEVMRRCYARGWITSRDGNCSVRFAGAPWIYVTPSGTRKTDLSPHHLVRVELTEDGMRIPPGQKPTGELWMHALLLQEAMTTRAVVHVHATHIVAAMYRGFDLPAICREFTEIQCHTKVGPSVPCLPPVSKALGEAVASALLNADGQPYDIVGMTNHGVCAIGSNPWAAYEHIERLDHICEIILKSGMSPSQPHA